MVIEGVKIRITGIVQGVGFRPFIYNLARNTSINGWVCNMGADVIIEAEGSKLTLDSFLLKIKKEAPPLSKIKDIEVQSKAFQGYSDFTIKKSIKSGEETVYISPDVSICEDCKNELSDSQNRRFLYPFINCTNCGPRFTLIKGVPYDRVNTTMDKFQMCTDCTKEYVNPTDRRYHAQPISCFKCGPRLHVLDSRGKKIETDDTIGFIVDKLLTGSIVAIKGLGGYHLACDALNTDSVRILRSKKIRDEKPFALMARDMEIALKYCNINQAERKLLESEKKPIVLLKKRDFGILPLEIAPGNPFLGIMLPYTPAHLLLFLSKATFLSTLNENWEKSINGEPKHKNELEALVMTSGNRGGEPIYYKDEGALENLSEIADYFLTNDREIQIRTDDSVTRIFRDREYILRRSRGYVPYPLTCKFMYEAPNILACGGELKSTFCLNKREELFMSHHIGDLENAETLVSFEEGIEHFKKLFDIEPKVVAYDLHPEYLSTKYALALEVENKIAVQHHHAHIAACMAENNLDEAVIGVAFDGTGYGEDGNLWGGEFFTGQYEGFKRQGHLEYIKMPGGEAAIKEPWRMAVSYLYKVGRQMDTTIHFNKISKKKIEALIQMLEKNINCPLTSSVGRLFDAVSALIGIRSEINYEGQAAIELEYISDKGYNGEYKFLINSGKETFNICVDEIFKGINSDIANEVTNEIISAKFHETIANVVLEGCKKIQQKTGLEKVVLSGGVFQNLTLLEKSIVKLEGSGFKVFIHSKVPSNDGGIALGQAVIAARRLKIEKN